MMPGELRISNLLVGQVVALCIQQVLWMAQRYSSNQQFRDAQHYFDRQLRRSGSALHNFSLQYGLYHLIELLRKNDSDFLCEGEEALADFPRS